jgi:peptide/nickel transport system ATP-binding protein
VVSDALLRVRLRASYGDRTVLNDVSFDLHAGEVLGLVGTSGAGKSTLVLALLGLLPWRGGVVTGEVLIGGKNLLLMKEREARKIRGKVIALVPQSPMTSLNSAVSLMRHFEEAWRAHESSGNAVLVARLKELMAQVHLPCDKEFLTRRPSQISVGQAQRMSMALALLHKPAVLVADEPTSALDPVTQAEVVRLLRKLSVETGTTLLYISHDLVSVLQLCDRLAVLSGGSIVECLPIAAVANAVHPSTRALLASLPVPARVLLQHRLSGGGEAVSGDASLPHNTAQPANEHEIENVTLPQAYNLRGMVAQPKST